jgi:hypothetical protein
MMKNPWREVDEGEKGTSAVLWLQHISGETPYALSRASKITDFGVAGGTASPRSKKNL